MEPLGTTVAPPWNHPRNTWNQPGATWNHLGSTGLEPPSSWNHRGTTWNHRVLRTQWRLSSAAECSEQNRHCTSGAVDQLKLVRCQGMAFCWGDAPLARFSLGPQCVAGTLHSCSHSCGHRRPHRPLSVRAIGSPGLALELRGTAALEVVTTTTTTTLAALIERRDRGVSARHVLCRGLIRTGGGAAAGSRSRASVLLHVHTQPDAAEQHETRPQIPTSASGTASRGTVEHRSRSREVNTRTN